VFVQFGRSLKPDLIVAQWNHLGDFNQINGDERCLLPVELWGRDEDYLWYSTGAAANFTDLASGVLGEATLQARYLRGAFETSRSRSVSMKPLGSALPLPNWPPTAARPWLLHRLKDPRRGGKSCATTASATTRKLVSSKSVLC